MQILDRRLNPSGRSLPNRQRFLRRAKSLVQEAVRDASAKRDIRSADEGEVTIPLHGIREPSFHLGQGGTRDHVLPGNKEYREGDEIQRPPSGGGGGGSEGSPDGSGEDTFRFVLSREEFLSLFLDDLELPDMAKRRLVDGADPVWHRAGYSVSGSPANLSLPRTMRNSLSRRIALRRPKPEEVEALEAEIAALEGQPEHAERVLALRAGAWQSSCCAAAAFPISTRSTSVTGASSPPPSGRPGGDVLPDGCLRLDDRGHEGPRQALLHAALSVPAAALQACGAGLHSAHP
ncbi:DUF444 family protein [Dankookia sp. P2]|uniref:DUF444 family protein n=1 Tax=Dankookia sp. P2 TaxID=3423955 RepID=UPI003D67B803